MRLCCPLGLLPFCFPSSHNRFALLSLPSECGRPFGVITSWLNTSAPRTLCYPYSQPNAMEKLDGKIKRIYCLEVGGVGLCKTLKRNVHVPAISFGVSRHHVSRVQHIRYVFYCVCCLYVHAFRRLFCSLRFSPAGWLILAFRKRCQFSSQRARKTDKKNGRFHYFSTL